MTNEEIVELLLRRGFLLEQKGDKIIVSDNSHEDDSEYLNALLHKYSIGYVKDNSLNIINPENAKKLYSMFDVAKPIDGEEFWNEKYNWIRFKRDFYGVKVAVKALEPNIARYCKAISACGIKTASSCDGNHNAGESKMFIVFESLDHKFWHQLIWKYILCSKFNIDWNDDCDAIALNTNNRLTIYNKLNNTAKYLYEHRIKFRNLKKTSAAFLTKSFCKKHSQDQIKCTLETEMKKYLAEITL